MKKYNYVHFVTDEKFIRDEIKCYEDACLTNNIYYYVGNKDYIFEFIDNKIVKIITKEEARLILNRENIDAVCLHNLYSLPFELIATIPNNIAVIWYAWGFDLYSNPAPLNPLLYIGERYMPETLKISRKTNLKGQLKRFAKKILEPFINDEKSIKIAQSAIARIDYFAGVFPVEYDMLKEHSPFFQAKLITHNYIHPHEFKQIDIARPIQITGNNILLGNSASMFGNHIDIMKQIAPFVEKDVKIICPLSYAGTPIYIQEVINQGKRIFGDRFVPLVEYMTLEEYTKTMQSCNRFVMGMIQQAATCNCLTSLWDGINIYAPKRSMNYRHYNDIGIKIYSIEEDFGRELDEQNANLLNNRIIIENTYSYRRWYEDLKESISIIFN